MTDIVKALEGLLSGKPQGCDLCGGGDGVEYCANCELIARVKAREALDAVPVLEWRHDHNGHNAVIRCSDGRYWMLYANVTDAIGAFEIRLATQRVALGTVEYFPVGVDHGGALLDTAKRRAEQVVRDMGVVFRTVTT